MFNFYKGFNKNKETKIVTDYVKITDIDRINQIREQRSGSFNKQQSVTENVPIQENKDIYRDRMNALKNIKKD